MNKSPFNGFGINTQAQLGLALKAIGTQWITAEMSASDLSQPWAEKQVRAVLAQGLPVLWIFHVGVDPKLISHVIDWGVTDITFNEPDLPDFTPDHTPWSATRTAAYYHSVSNLIGKRARLWGPGISHVDGAYLRAFMGANPGVYGICLHGYGCGALDALVDYISQEYGLPVVIGEDGAVDALGAIDNTDPAGWLLRRKAQMGARPWCWYPGVTSDPNDHRALFAVQNGVGEPTAVYKALTVATPA